MTTLGVYIIVSDEDSPFDYPVCHRPVERHPASSICRRFVLRENVRVWKIKGRFQIRYRRFHIDLGTKELIWCYGLLGGAFHQLMENLTEFSKKASQCRHNLK